MILTTHAHQYINIYNRFFLSKRLIKLPVHLYLSI